MKDLSWEQLNQIIELSYDGIYITDGYANTLRINKAYEIITGLNRSKMIGKNMSYLEQNGFISRSATLMVLKNKSEITIEQEYKNGKKAIISSTPIFNNKNEIILVVTNVRDITKIVNLKKKLNNKVKIIKEYNQKIKEFNKNINFSNDIVIKDEKMLELMNLVNKIAKVDTTVLILGETGVGKGEIAKYIYKNSNRYDKPFLEINCGSIPHTLIEAELFGYKEGAFTGANKFGKIGVFEAANGGTLVLDEIGELTLDMQVKLLRVLQNNEIIKIGDIKPKKIDVRIIAITNKNLEEMVKKNTFRKDLYYRLNIIPLIIPPLRERKQDIFPLTQKFLSYFNEKYNFEKYFDSRIIKCFYEYDWPGNIRELKNIIERLVVISDDNEIIIDNLPTKMQYILAKNFNRIVSLKSEVEKLEYNLIKESYKKYKNVRDAAAALGIDASTFVRKRKKYMKIY